MGHYINTHEVRMLKFNPVRPTYCFDEWWRTQEACHRDGCRTTQLRIDSCETLTKVREERFRKTMKKKYGDFLEYPSSYTCNAVMMGIVGWCCERKVKRIIDHHVREVIERKTYKTKPTKGLKGGTIYAIGKYIMSYDARDYDPMEHC